MAWIWIVLIVIAYILLWILTTSLLAYVAEEISAFAASAICILWPLVWLLLFISFQANKLMVRYDKELNNKKGK